MNPDGEGLPAGGLSAYNRRTRMTVSALDTLTDLDKRIIVALQRDGRANWRAIADAIDAPYPRCRVAVSN